MLGIPRVLQAASCPWRQDGQRPAESDFIAWLLYNNITISAWGLTCCSGASPTPAPPEAPAAPQRAALLAWLHEHVSDEARRVFVLRACDGLDDLAAAPDAEDVLSLDTWPALARARFLRALAALRGERP